MNKSAAESLANRALSIIERDLEFIESMPADKLPKDIAITVCRYLEVLQGTQKIEKSIESDARKRFAKLSTEELRKLANLPVAIAGEKDEG